MRESIREYLVLSVDEKKKIWKKADFVFDTNILLNFYKYSDDTRNELFNAIERLGGRVWLPDHVLCEFMKKRASTIFECVQRYDTIKKDTEKFIIKISETLLINPKSNGLDVLSENIFKIIDKLKDKDLSVTHPAEDKILERLLSIFNKKIGEKYTDEKLKEIYVLGYKRYQKNFPPGYKDRVKEKSDSIHNGEDSYDDINNQYGDFVIWSQILDSIKKKDRDIIFITNDKKEDWWEICSGKTLGPRVELKREFYNNSDNDILFYDMMRFLDFSNKFESANIPSSVMEEVGIYETKNNESEMKSNTNINLYLKKIIKNSQKFDELVKRTEHINKTISAKQISIDKSAFRNAYDNFVSHSYAYDKDDTQSYLEYLDTLDTLATLSLNDISDKKIDEFKKLQRYNKIMFSNKNDDEK
jgi:predicted nucleic acid-binding protein